MEAAAPTAKTATAAVKTASPSTTVGAAAVPAATVLGEGRIRGQGKRSKRKNRKERLKAGGRFHMVGSATADKSAGSQAPYSWIPLARGKLPSILGNGQMARLSAAGAFYGFVQGAESGAGADEEVEGKAAVLEHFVEDGGFAAVVEGEAGHVL